MEQSVRCTYCSSVPFRAHVRETSGRVPVFSLSLFDQTIKVRVGLVSLSLFEKSARATRAFSLWEFLVGAASLFSSLSCVGLCWAQFAAEAQWEEREAKVDPTRKLFIFGEESGAVPMNGLVRAAWSSEINPTQKSIRLSLINFFLIASALFIPSSSSLSHLQYRRYKCAYQDPRCFTRCA
jgi:hypothetical protein